MFSNIPDKRFSVPNSILCVCVITRLWVSVPGASMLCHWRNHSFPVYSSLVSCNEYQLCVCAVPSLFLSISPSRWNSWASLDDAYICLALCKDLKQLAKVWNMLPNHSQLSVRVVVYKYLCCVIFNTSNIFIFRWWLFSEIYNAKYQMIVIT